MKKILVGAFVAIITFAVLGIVMNGLIDSLINAPQVIENVHIDIYTRYGITSTDLNFVKIYENRIELYKAYIDNKGTVQKVYMVYKKTDYDSIHIKSIN